MLVSALPSWLWVEKPARLFQQLLSETIRAGGSRLVVGEGDFGYSAATKLSGRLLDMGFDASSGSVVVRFDAVLQGPDGKVSTKRFENRVSGVASDAASVGPALNQAANAVAAEVARASAGVTAALASPLRFSHQRRFFHAPYIIRRRSCIPLHCWRLSGLSSFLPRVRVHTKPTRRRKRPASQTMTPTLRSCASRLRD